MYLKEFIIGCLRSNFFPKESTTYVVYLCTEINECYSSPCLNDGTCKDDINSYTCACVDGYTDLECSTGAGGVLTIPGPFVIILD